ncbi:MAG: hypothetical protein MUF68_02215 [Cyclobacteriaceae bacterium]|jgi:hypothetical protein|nr:hypothetical protein [Cyclobacteriaceae bacterium]
MKTKNLLSLIVYFSLLTLFSSCDKTDDPPANEEKLIVHLSGESYDGTSYRATYWKNGEKTFLQETGNKGYATSLTVKDGDVYVGGIDYTVQPYTSVIWKNGKLDQTINATTFNYTALIDFSGEDLYACTQQVSDQIVYYKKNVKTNFHDGQLYGFTVLGNDLYACGRLSNSITKTFFPVYWKNGNSIQLSAPNSDLNTTATKIKVSGNDVYVSGYGDYINAAIKDEAILWKNGVKTVLPSNGHARAENVILHGNDVYVVGWSSDEIGGVEHATYWKNGVKTVLDNSTKFSGLYDLAISSKGEVYAIGYLGDNENGAMWVDGKLDGTINGSPIGSIYNIVLEEK